MPVSFIPKYPVCLALCTAVWQSGGDLYSRAIAANGSLTGLTQPLFPRPDTQQATAVAGEIQQASAASNTPAPAVTATPTLPPRQPDWSTYE